jgi:uncharacterized protein (DUF2252 family)
MLDVKVIWLGKERKGEGVFVRSKALKFPGFKERQSILGARRSLKTARSAHAYVRGNTRKFYEWLGTAAGQELPRGPAVWICGEGHIDIQIRDLDQTVIGNPAHDLIRLGLSLATAVRGSDLPGVTTAKMVEQLIEGYEHAFTNQADEMDFSVTGPRP